jgi:hypothetical protein
LLTSFKAFASLLSALPSPRFYFWNIRISSLTELSASIARLCRHEDGEMNMMLIDVYFLLLNLLSSIISKDKILEAAVQRSQYFNYKRQRLVLIPAQEMWMGETQNTYYGNMK